MDQSKQRGSAAVENIEMQHDTFSLLAKKLQSLLSHERFLAALLEMYRFKWKYFHEVRCYLLGGGNVNS
jgi:hypothetical protein